MKIYFCTSVVQIENLTCTCLFSVINMVPLNVCDHSQGPSQTLQFTCVLQNNAYTTVLYSNY